jgi:taurine transport system substrate-binding protein
MKNVLKTIAASAAAAMVALGLSAAAATAADREVTIGYQTSVEPSKVPQADGVYEKTTGWKIDWRKFDNGADVIAALASGDVQIGYVGSSPLAAAASREVPFETFWIAGLIGDAEALAVRNGSGIDKPADLIGKKVAVPFVSTAHYSLLAALKHWQIDPAKVTVLNLRAGDIPAAWARGDIDAAYVWDPALGKIKETGKILTSSADVAKWGAPTFDAWIVRKDFAEKGADFVSAFTRVTGEAYAAYRADPKAWSAASAAKIAHVTGAKVEDVPGLLAGYVLPSAQEQASPDLLGGGTTKAIAATAAFLKEQKKVDKVLDDYGPYVTARFAKTATATAKD